MSGSGSFVSNTQRRPASDALIAAAVDKHLVVTKKGVATWGNINDVLPIVGVTDGEVLTFNAIGGWVPAHVEAVPTPIVPGAILTSAPTGNSAVWSATASSSNLFPVSNLSGTSSVLWRGLEITDMPLPGTTYPPEQVMVASYASSTWTIAWAPVGGSVLPPYVTDGWLTSSSTGSSWFVPGASTMLATDTNGLHLSVSYAVNSGVVYTDTGGVLTCGQLPVINVVAPNTSGVSIDAGSLLVSSQLTGNQWFTSTTGTVGEANLTYFQVGTGGSYHSVSIGPNCLVVGSYYSPGKLTTVLPPTSSPGTTYSLVSVGGGTSSGLTWSDSSSLPVSMSAIVTNSGAANQVMIASPGGSGLTTAGFVYTAIPYTNITAGYPLTSVALGSTSAGVVVSNGTVGSVISPTSGGSWYLSASNSATPTWQLVSSITVDVANIYTNRTANQLLYTNGAGLSFVPPGASGILMTDSSSVPSISSTLPTAVQSNITVVGTVTGGTWNANTLALNYGGTGAVLAANAGGIVYSTSSAMGIVAPGSVGQVLTSAGTGRQFGRHQPWER